MTGATYSSQEQICGLIMFTEKYSQPGSSETRRRASVCSPSSSSTIETPPPQPPPGILLPPFPVTHLVESSPNTSSDPSTWEFPWLNENALDNLNFGNEPSRAGLRFIPEDWTSQTKTSEAQTSDQLFKQLIGSEPRCFSKSINDDNQGPSNSTANNLASHGVSPLHIAARKGRVNIVRLLLEHDVDCNAQDDVGMTPLIHATIGDHKEVVELLLSKGAEVRFSDYQNRSSLHWAVVCRCDRLLKILLRYCNGDKSVIDGLSSEGTTPLHVAVDIDFEAGVELLLNAGADAQYKSRHSVKSTSYV